MYVGMYVCRYVCSLANSGSSLSKTEISNVYVFYSGCPTYRIWVPLPGSE